MTVRVKQLYLGLVTSTGDPQVVYTVPAGMRTIWKFGTLYGSDSFEATIGVLVGVTNFLVWRHNVNTGGIEYPSVYVVLNAAQSLTIGHTAGVSKTIAAGLYGTELLL